MLRIIQEKAVVRIPPIMPIALKYPYCLSLGTGPEKKAKIFFKNYQGDFHDLYVNFDGASEFSTFEAVSCTGNEKNRYFTQKKHKNAN